MPKDERDQGHDEAEFSPKSPSEWKYIGSVIRGLKHLLPFVRGRGGDYIDSQVDGAKADTSIKQEKAQSEKIENVSKIFDRLSNAKSRDEKLIFIGMLKEGYPEVIKTAEDLAKELNFLGERDGLTMEITEGEPDRPALTAGGPIDSGTPPPSKYTR